MDICITAVGNSYNEDLLKFLNEGFSEQFNFHILTDKPELYPSHDTDLYYSPIFNYFDKISYALTKLTNIQKPGIFCDADDLHLIQYLINYLDRTSSDIQLHGYYDNKKQTYNNRLPELDNNFWDFFTDFLKENNTPEDKVCMVLEKFIYFPALDYTELRNNFESLKLKFTVNSFNHNNDKAKLGNGEGVALGYALYKSNLNFRVIDTSNP